MNANVGLTRACNCALSASSRLTLIAFGMGLAAAVICSPAFSQTVFLVDPVPVPWNRDLAKFVCEGSHPYPVGQSCFRVEQQNLAQKSSVEALQQDVAKLKSDSLVSQQNIKSISDAIDALTSRLNKDEQKAN